MGSNLGLGGIGIKLRRRLGERKERLIAKEWEV